MVWNVNKGILHFRAPFFKNKGPTQWTDTMAFNTKPNWNVLVLCALCRYQDKMVSHQLLSDENVLCAQHDSGHGHMPWHKAHLTQDHLSG